MRNIYVTICYKYNENVISIQGTGSMALYFVYSFEIEQYIANLRKPLTLLNNLTHYLSLKY